MHKKCIPSKHFFADSERSNYPILFLDKPVLAIWAVFVTTDYTHIHPHTHTQTHPHTPHTRHTHPKRKKKLTYVETRHKENDNLRLHVCTFISQFVRGSLQNFAKKASCSDCAQKLTQLIFDRIKTKKVFHLHL